jgi:hypothetical protein
VCQHWAAIVPINKCDKLCIFTTEMNITRNDYQRLFSKWLFAAVLILSFFTFSGLVVKQQPKFAAQKTELVKANESRAAKSITFNRASKQIPGIFNTQGTFSVQIISLARVHSGQVKMQFINCRLHKALPAGFFYRYKTIPGTNDAEPVASA